MKNLVLCLALIGFGIHASHSAFRFFTLAPMGGDTASGILNGVVAIFCFALAAGSLRRFFRQ